MKRQIRSCVFETNSSSMHSLVVMKHGNYMTKEEITEDFKNVIDEKGVWKIRNEDDLYFGRYPFSIISSFKEKWMYAMASLVKEYGDSKHLELINLATNIVPNLKSIELPYTIHSIGVDRCGESEGEFLAYIKKKSWYSEKVASEIEYWRSGNYWDYETPYIGGVDDDILSGFLKKEMIQLEEFLLSKRYVVIQDGDEYCIFDQLKESGLIKTDEIDYEYYGWEEN